RQSTCRPVADNRLNLLAQVPYAKHHFCHALTFQIGQLTQYEGLAGHVHQGLGNGLGDWMKAGGQTTREDSHRELHENSTFVPSKSNANRTSSRPALVMAWRSLLRSLA